MLGGGAMHLVLRLAGRRSDFDTLLNLLGMAGLVVGAFLFLWDWLWLGLGGLDQVALGISHLVIDGWWFVLVVTGLKRLLGVPVGWGLVASFAAFAAGFPLAVVLMRSPL
jgi:hypothetical protein